MGEGTGEGKDGGEVEMKGRGGDRGGHGGRGLDGK